MNKDDEINLIELFTLLWTKKLFILSMMLISIGIATIYITFAPKEYKSYTTFVIKSNNYSQISAYSSILGMKQNSIESTVLNLLKSNHIKERVTNSIKQQMIEKKNNKESKNITEINNIIKNLYLDKNIKVKKNIENNLTILSYINKNKKISALIIEEYLKQLSLLNATLNITANKELITIIDPVKEPLHPFRPKKKLALIISILGSFIFSSMFVFFKEAFIENSLQKQT
ncbi:hypothetical protein DID76_02780 [Candidatus Marinamargulisbacteria bacterium SCGC AG-414-C22]|nr:hypothetical protein DID76_02780 [Candidatus Marinamargulisbacteria bacterium SCGC AG-414-C22]